jgi:outer membrane protein assembly factor BamA
MGSDAVAHHGLAAALRIDTERSDPDFAISYGYGRLPFDFGVSLFRQAVPSNGTSYVEQRLGVTSGIGYTLPSDFESNSFSLSYSLYRFDGTIPAVESADPDDPIVPRPSRGQIGAITLGWSYSNGQSYLHSVGGERGFSLSAYTSIAAAPLASDFTLYTFGYSATDYVPMPWARHHTLALHASAAVLLGDYPRRGAYSNGGFGDTPLLRAVTLGTFQSPFVLRGYLPGAFSGNQYHLYNAEYRFPIVNIDRGFSTLPLFFQRVSGSFFADYGGAFYDLDPHDWTDKFHLGVGAEIWIECTVGYFLNPMIRFGYAHGVDDAAAVPGGQTYTVISLPF